ncbi:hypothetical protein EDD21DRAFT_177329 [Dissophora ornata]|nr:hypothetical protein EDD21DRAFT_177329 [Dissophora ornata]
MKFSLVGFFWFWMVGWLDGYTSTRSCMWHMLALHYLHCLHIPTVVSGKLLTHSPRSRVYTQRMFVISVVSATQHVV